jgi:hypothetical protein
MALIWGQLLIIHYVGTFGYFRLSFSLPHPCAAAILVPGTRVVVLWVKAYIDLDSRDGARNYCLLILLVKSLTIAPAPHLQKQPVCLSTVPLAYFSRTGETPPLSVMQ